jgi:hypothetical protein
LTQGTKEDIRKAVKYSIEKLAPRGEFFSKSNLEAQTLNFVKKEKIEE